VESISALKGVGEDTTERRTRLLFPSLLESKKLFSQTTLSWEVSVQVLHARTIRLVFSSTSQAFSSSFESFANDRFFSSSSLSAVGADRQSSAAKAGAACKNRELMRENKTRGKDIHAGAAAATNDNPVAAVAPRSAKLEGEFDGGIAVRVGGAGLRGGVLYI
jgi:hypothetical protein